MKIVKKLSNPFVLVAQGFVVGAVLFAATPSHEAPRQAAAPVSDYQLPAA